MARTSRNTNRTRRTRRNSQGRRTPVRRTSKSKTRGRGPAGKGKKTQRAKPRDLETISSNTDEGRYYGVITNVLGNQVDVKYHGPSAAGGTGKGVHTTRATLALRKGKGKLRLRPHGLVVIELSQLGSRQPARVIHTYRENEEAAVKAKRNFPKSLLRHRSTGSSSNFFA